MPTVSGGTDWSASSDHKMWVPEHCGDGAAPALLQEPLQNLKCDSLLPLFLPTPFTNGCEVVTGFFSLAVQMSFLLLEQRGAA